MSSGTIGLGRLCRSRRKDSDIADHMLGQGQLMATDINQSKADRLRGLRDTAIEVDSTMVKSPSKAPLTEFSMRHALPWTREASP